MNRLIRGLTSGFLLVTANLGFAQTDAFPSKPIQVVLTSTPGSQSDTLMRFLGTEVSKKLGQPLVITYQASAAGTIGADQVKRARPDGYTLLLGGNTVMAANVHLVKNLAYDPVRDFESVALVTFNPLVLVVRSGLPVNSVKDFVAYAKARPGELNYATGNAGNKVAVSQLESLTGIKTTEIPYKGATPAIMDLVAGRLDFIMADPLVADPFIKQGTVRALAVTGPIRMPTMKALPTMADAGVAGYQEFGSFLGIYAPHGTPKAVIDSLNEAFTKAIQSKEGQDFYDNLGLAPRTSTPAGLASYTREQIVFWEKLVRLSGLQAQ